ncbi:Uncharacterized protein APZ42_004372 [Daphnia magna]|uniref:Uncharacterized protein n=1 Tax=Daphnia magna TaxID=35525 RepID=A0A164H3P7_9CRUS|nr:Uncharacterized protein APZ42_004372 [Daphnia magna]
MAAKFILQQLSHFSGLSTSGKSSFCKGKSLRCHMPKNRDVLSGNGVVLVDNFQ